MNQLKVKKLLSALDPLNSQVEEALKLASKQLKDSISSRTAEEARTNFKKIEKILKDVLAVFETFKSSLSETEKTIQNELQIRLNSLRKELQVSSDLTRDSLLADITLIERDLKKLANRPSPQFPDFTPQIQEVQNELLGIISRENSQLESNFQEQKTALEKIATEIEEKLKRFRTEILSRVSHAGGNANRNIAIGGNTSVLSTYTDINLKAGSNVTITYSKNNTTKYTDITIASTGGGGSVGGTVRSINNISTSQTAGATAGTDYVYICSAGLALTLPPAAANTNLYTVKNTSTSSVVILPDGADTIDDTSNAILSFKYTQIDTISDGIANWNIT